MSRLTHLRLKIVEALPDVLEGFGRQLGRQWEIIERVFGVILVWPPGPPIFRKIYPIEFKLDREVVYIESKSMYVRYFRNIKFWAIWGYFLKSKKKVAILTDFFSPLKRKVHLSQDFWQILLLSDPSLYVGQL